MTYLQLTLSKIKTFYTAHSFSASNADFQNVIQDWLFLMCLHELLWHRNDILYLQYYFLLLTGLAVKTWIESKLCVLWYSLLMHNISQTKQIPFESAVWYSVIVVWRFYICNRRDYCVRHHIFGQQGRCDRFSSSHRARPVRHTSSLRPHNCAWPGSRNTYSCSP